MKKVKNICELIKGIAYITLSIVILMTSTILTGIVLSYSIFVDLIAALFKGKSPTRFMTRAFEVYNVILGAYDIHTHYLGKK